MNRLVALGISICVGIVIGVGIGTIIIAIIRMFHVV